MDHEHFKLCPGCHRWLSLDEVLHHPEIRPLGLTLAGDSYETTWFYFQHEAPDCRSSFVVPADWFRSAIDEQIPDEVMTGTEVCQGRCMHIEDWLQCTNNCHHAPFRRLLVRMAESRQMNTAAPAPDETPEDCSHGEVTRVASSC